MPVFWIFPAFKIHLSEFLLLNKIISKFTTEHKRVLLDIKKLHSDGSWTCLAPFTRKLISLFTYANIFSSHLSFT